jgi:hypothetical protein
MSTGDAEKYREWLRARGIQNPSEAVVERFKERTRKSPYGSLYEFLVIAWLNTRSEYAGTRIWLRAEGLSNPSEQDLKAFTRRITKAILLRGSVTLLLLAAWLAFIWLTGLPRKGLQLITAVGLVLLGLGTSCGSRWPGTRPSVPTRADR